MDFSDKLREIRKREGLSQEQLAEKIGVSRQAITKWETGKGMPDIENMVILSEIFKTTLDDLIHQSVTEKHERRLYTSETVYDIDCEKHFDLHIGSAGAISISSGSDEKLHIKLESETLEDLSSIFKIKLDEKKNKLDVNCIKKNKISRYEAEEAVSVYVVLPEKYADHCELAASVKQLNIRNLNIRRLEYDGDAVRATITNSSGSIEFTSKTDYDIMVDRVEGKIDVNQWRAKTVLHIDEENLVPVVNKGRKCNVYFVKNGESAEPEIKKDSENVISISGIGSELTIDLK